MNRFKAFGVVLVAIPVIAAVSLLVVTKYASQIDKEGTKNTAENSQESANTEKEVEYRTVQLFYYDISKSECIGYEYQPRGTEPGEEAVKKGLIPVERKIEDSDHIIEDTIRLFLEGKVTDEEKAQGVYTANFDGKYPIAGLELTDLSLSADGTLNLTFNDPEGNTIGTFCSVEIKRQQLEATARQFPEVKSVKILSNPHKEVFYIRPSEFIEVEP